MFALLGYFEIAYKERKISKKNKWILMQTKLFKVHQILNLFELKKGKPKN